MSFDDYLAQTQHPPNHKPKKKERKIKERKEKQNKKAMALKQQSNLFLFKFILLRAYGC
jgi:hypothetical protein